MQTETTTAEKLVKSFKDVHADLERESLLLRSRDIQVKDFLDKADFLSRIGFHESIATKLYRSVAYSVDLVGDYIHRYGQQSKFILPAQLERVCEKYDLYVRSTTFFMGDIPVKNLQDMMNFRLYLCDIEHSLWQKGKLSELVYEFFEAELTEICTQNCIPFPKYSWDVKEDKYNKIITEWLATDEGKKKYITLPQLCEYDNGQISIAAVKSLFSERAFSQTTARIPNTFDELSAKSQVDLDPIVLCRVKQGYLVVTAWGDEANDELVANQKLN